MFKGYFWTAVFALGLSAQSVQAYASEIVVNAKFKELVVRKDNSEQIDLLKTKKTQMLLVNFWATWCEACKVELKEMAEMFDGLASKVTLAFVSLDKDPEEAKQWVTKNIKSDLIKSNLYYDPDFKLADRIGVDAFPLTMILMDESGVIYVQRGFKEGEKSTEKMVDLIKAK